MDLTKLCCIILTLPCIYSANWQESVLVYGYETFHSVVPLKYNIPEGTSHVTWSFRASKESPSNNCKDRHVAVYLKEGGLPLVFPKNETLPSDFHVLRSDIHHLLLTSDNSSHEINVLWPTPGSWYAIAFRPKSNDDIKQKGLYLQCNYKIASSISKTPSQDIEKITLNEESTYQVDSSGKILKFYIGIQTFQYTLYISKCATGECSVNLTLADMTYVCVTPPCSYLTTSPWIQRWQYLYIKPENDINVTLSVLTKECEDVNNEDSLMETNSTCIIYPVLDRFQYSSRDFRVDFMYIINETLETSIDVLVSPNTTTVIPFKLKDTIDTGGTLGWSLTVETDKKNINRRFEIIGVIQYGRYPLSNISDDDVDLIASTNRLIVNNSASGGKHKMYIPYPETGVWFIALNVECYITTLDNGSWVSTVCTNQSYSLSVRVWTDRCLDNECSGHGECKEYIVGSSLVIYSTCVCGAGWQGYACSDGSHAFSNGRQLEEILLLTLSNAFFLPAIIVAIKRGYYTEAVVYVYNMFFSTMYHACDGNRVQKFTYCLMEYNTLSFCDFLASVASLWFTIVAMAKIHGQATNVLRVLALLGLPIGVLTDRRSLWLIAAPLLIGGVMVAAAWVMKCRGRRQCYPSKKRYFMFLVPGVLIAGTGASVFAFAETQDNYRYVHSFWHFCLFTCVLFLLPPAPNKAKQSSCDDDVGLIMPADQISNQVI